MGHQPCAGTRGAGSLTAEVALPTQEVQKYECFGLKKQPRMLARSFRIQPITAPGSRQGPGSPVAKDAQRLLLGGKQISPHLLVAASPGGGGRDQVSQGVVADRRKLDVLKSVLKVL